MNMPLPKALKKYDDKTLTAIFCLLTVYLIWGTTMGAMRIGVASMPPLWMAGLRFFASGIIILSYCALRQEKWPPLKECLQHALIGFLLFIVGNAMSIWAMQYVTTALGGVLVATTPFWMLWLSSILPPKEKIPSAAWMGVAVGFTGMLILISPLIGKTQNSGLHHELVPQQLFWLGVMALLATPFFWSLGSIMARRTKASSSMMMSVGLQNLFAGVIMLPLLFAFPMANPASIPIDAWLALGYLVLFGTIIAMPCYLFILQNMSVSVTSTFAYVTPVITLIFGVLFLGEQLTQPMTIGSLVVLSGVVIAQRKPHSASAMSAETVEIAEVELDHLHYNDVNSNKELTQNGIRPVLCD